MARIFVLILSALITYVHGNTSVHILAENLEQVITSSTLQWISSYGLNDTMLETAVVAAYQTMEDEDSSEDGPSSRKPVYICRAKANSIWVSGQLRPKKRACIVSIYKRVSEYSKFEVLNNIENGARLSWVYRDRYKLNPQGAVTCGEDTLKTFVARRSAKSHNKRGSLTYYVGKFNPQVNLGVFDVVDQNNNELRFEDGEILVETEPISYEFKAIKFDRLRSRDQKKRKILGEAILKNTESGIQRVDTVISYKYPYSIFWGKGHGLLTGLPFTVHLPNSVNIDGNWALPKSEERVETKTIEKYLDEGTAVNVTLYGNYTESETPYTASISALYADNERRERFISDSKREQLITDVIIEYGPVYYIYNNSFVPTTTTTTTSTTTSTTSMTTSKTTSTTEEATPIVPPQVLLAENSEKKREETIAANKKPVHNNIMNDGQAGSDALSMKTTESTKANSSTRFFINFMIICTMSIINSFVT